MNTFEGDFALENEFEVVRELGRGGFSLVTEVHRKGKEKGVATACKITPIDTLRKSGRDPAAFNARLARLKHISDTTPTTHFLHFFDWRWSNEDFISFFELALGGDLFTRVVDSPEGHLDEEDARKAAYGLLEALRDMPGLGLIHRDIKPDNILFRLPSSGIGEVVLADWSNCVEGAHEGDMFTEFVGTAGYMAPEMAAGLPYDAKVDIFSAGVTIYEMLSGRSPFRAEDPKALLLETIQKRIPFPKQYWSKHSPEAKDFVQCMVEKDPSLRWSAAQLMRHPWLAPLTEAVERTGEFAGTSLEEEDEFLMEAIRRISSASTSSNPSEASSSDASDFTDDSLSLTRSLSSRATSLQHTRAAMRDGLFETGSMLQGGALSQDYSDRFAKLEL